MDPASPPPVNERAVVFLIGAVQFINILEFMMVMPLGPDFAAALGVPVSRLGLIGGAYTAAAAVSGLLGAFFLDRLERRRALALSLFGLVVGTAAGGFAVGFYSLIAARLVAGFFGGPATSLALSIVADVVPTERRGRAMGAVMGAVSVAQVLGVPAGLRLALALGWRAPLFAIAALGLVVNAAALRLLPALPAPSAGSKEGSDNPLQLLRNPLIRLSYGMTAAVMMAGFLVIPNISAFTQFNMRWPRDRLESLFLLGGVATFTTMRLTGWLVDRFGSLRVMVFAAAALCAVTWRWFCVEPPGLPLPLLMVAFFIAISARNVAYNTLTSKVPAAGERARFMSLQSATAHLASSTGAILSAQMLHEQAGHQLVGMPRVAALSLGLTVLAPVMVALVERRVRAQRTAS